MIKLQYLITFLEGLISFISPCFLPMLPVYLAYFAGDAQEGASKRTLTHSLVFAAGFTAVFVSMGLFAGYLGSLISGGRTILNIVCGALIVVFGLMFMEVIPMPRLFNARAAKKPDTALGAFLFGLVFAVSLTPCVGAFLGSALALASNQGTAAEGALLLFVYSMGLALPLVLSALLISRLKSAFDFIKRHYKAVNTVAGVFLIAVGVLMALGLLDKLFAAIV